MPVFSAGECPNTYTVLLVWHNYVHKVCALCTALPVCLKFASAQMAGSFNRLNSYHLWTVQSQPLDCKVRTSGHYSQYLCTIKSQPLDCKVTTSGLMSHNLWNVKSQPLDITVTTSGLFSHNLWTVESLHLDCRVTTTDL